MYNEYKSISRCKCPHIFTGSWCINIARVFSYRERTGKFL
jgi:hypothetical protein